MDLTANWHMPEVEIQAVRSPARCAICHRRARDGMVALHERVDLLRFDIPGPCQTWLFCGGCAAAVAREVERSALSTPLRTRIAVGMVAAERMPQRRLAALSADFWEQMPAQQFDRLMAATVLALFAIPPLFFLIVTVLVARSAPGP